MSNINILNVSVLDNPTAFTNSFQFEIQFECLQALDEDLEWKLIYVGSAEDNSYDQVLEEVMVGPVVAGVHKFILQSPAPNHQIINNQDLIGVTVILLTCCYIDQEFVRIGYYVNNEYGEQYDPENPPNPVDIKLLYRNILADQPRVTRFAIDWSGNGQPPAALVGTFMEGGNGTSSESGQGELAGDGEEDEMNADDADMDEYAEEDDDMDEDEDEEDGDVEIDIEEDEEEEDGEGADEDEAEDDDGEDNRTGTDNIKMDPIGGHALASAPMVHFSMNEDSMDIHRMQSHFEGSNFSNSYL